MGTGVGIDADEHGDGAVHTYADVHSVGVAESIHMERGT